MGGVATSALSVSEVPVPPQAAVTSDRAKTMPAAADFLIRRPRCSARLFTLPMLLGWPLKSLAERSVRSSLLDAGGDVGIAGAGEVEHQLGHHVGSAELVGAECGGKLVLNVH